MRRPRETNPEVMESSQAKLNNVANIKAGSGQDKKKWGQGQIQSTWEPEIERAIVFAAWRHPEFIDLILVSIDPDLHFLDKTCRVLFEIICTVWWESGATDFALVLKAINEIEFLEDCGGIEGLNDIFTYDGKYPEGFGKFAQASISEYVRLLDYYRQQRDDDPSERVIRYTGGKGRLWLNRSTKNDNSPSHFGEALIRGSRYRIACWPAGDQIELKFTPEGRA